MKYQGQTIEITVDHEEEGIKPLAQFLGVTPERSEVIKQALEDHRDSCREKVEGGTTFHCDRLMAGPQELDLATPNEVLFAGMVIRSMYLNEQNRSASGNVIGAILKAALS